MKLDFTKMEGTGNDFILLDNQDSLLGPDTNLSALAHALCSRHYGIGADGIILVQKSKALDIQFRIFNADGSEPEMCGNGMRCFASYVYGHHILDKTVFKVETLAGSITPELILDESGLVSSVRVDMGEPVLAFNEIPFVSQSTEENSQILTIEDINLQVTPVSMGNPHAVIFVDDINQVDVKKLGSQIENHPAFPEKTNVEFVQVMGNEELSMKVWERGVGETLACGTGACAALVAPVSEKAFQEKLWFTFLVATLTLNGIKKRITFLKQDRQGLSSQVQ